MSSLIFVHHCRCFQYNGGMSHLYTSRQQLIDLLKPTYGHAFKEFDVNNRLAHPNNKGVLGQIVEEGIFHYPINSNPKADFDNLGLELKTAGVKKNKKNNDISAKERLPLDAINFNTVINSDFEHSDVWQKSKGLLLVLYEFLEKVFKGDFKIINSIIHDFDKNDMLLFEQDYDIIVDKIKRGLAHTLSGSDTLYLEACTAGQNKDDKTSQPFSSIMARRRKFAIKASYITAIIRSHLSKTEREHIVNQSELKTNTFEDIVINKIEHYKGRRVDALCNRFGLDSSSKSYLERLTAKMLGMKGSINKSDEFQKANIELKTIRVNKDGSITESMSFPAFEFTKIVEQEWEDSDFRDLIEQKKFLFVIFKNDGDGFVLRKAMFWSAPLDDLDTKGKAVFDKLKTVLTNGEIVRGFRQQKNKTIRLTNFPGMKFNGFIHIRPHGQDSNDTYPLPVADKLTGVTSYTKQCFWFNNSYIEKVIK